MKKREIIGGLFWLIAGLFFTALSAGYPVGGLTRPGPGLLPLCLGILLSVFSVIILIRAGRLEGGGEKAALFPGDWLRVVGAVAAFMVAALFFETAGYLLTFLFLGFVLPLLTGWITVKGSAVFAVLSVAGIYLIFVWLLKQPLPVGFLGV